MDGYTILKAAHIFGAIIFLGNIIVTGVWKVLADRTGNPFTVAYAQRMVNLTDLIFTAPGAFLIVVSGRMMARHIGGVTNLYWLNWGWWLFIASGVVWVVVLIPVQIRQTRLARQFRDGRTQIPENYHRLSKTWLFAGTLATILPLINLYFMIFQPVTTQ